jgi:diacylglycerol kinase family enzyme
LNTKRFGGGRRVAAVARYNTGAVARYNTGAADLLDVLRICTHASSGIHTKGEREERVKER